MGKEWDDDKGGRKQWVAWMTEVMTECLRVMKPGAHGLVWALPRTSHWTATALEDAGFEVRDVVTHLFGTGFPKSYNIAKGIDKQLGAEPTVVGKLKSPASTNRVKTMGRPEQSGSGWNEEPDETVATSDAAKQWEGWGTALKPASEHWILIRKPCSEKTVAANVLKHGTGGINIDGCRVAAGEDHAKNCNRSSVKSHWGNSEAGNAVEASPLGRFPANLILDEDAAQALDEQSGDRPSGGGDKSSAIMGYHGGAKGYGPRITEKSNGGASRFFYVAKASKSDKGEGNTHPTVKSTALMEYLIKLVTPPNGVVLDPFMGSGSTGVAAIGLAKYFIGIEQSPEYFQIAINRLKKAKEELDEQLPELSGAS